MGQFAEEDSQIYIERNDGTTATGDPFGVFAKLRAAKGLIEFQRGLVEKAKRDAAEAQRRKALPPLPPPANLPPQAPATPSPAKETDPGTSDTPPLQGAPAVDPEATVKLQDAEPLISRPEPSHEAWRQTDPLDIPALLARLFPPPASGADASAIEARVRRNQPEPGERHPSHAAPAPQRPATAADPVDLFTGAFGLSAVDLVVPTAHIPIALHRSYRSGRPYFGPFGFGWDHGYNIYLRRLNDGGAAVWNGQLREQHFVAEGSGWVPEPGVVAQLERLAGPGEHYQIRRPPHLTWLFEQPSGWSDTERFPLVEIRDRHGNAVRLVYGMHDQLVSVLDEAGRGLFFSYGTCDLLEAVTDHSGSRSVSYAHDAEVEHLVRVTLPPTAEFPAGIATSYVYDRYAPHPAMQHNILQVYDAHDQLTLENEFAGPGAGWAFNSVVRQRIAGFEYRFEYLPLQYVWPDPQNVDLIAAQTLVRPPDGSLHTYTFNYRGEPLDHRYRLIRDGSFRIVASKWAYDVEGNVATTVAPDGQRETFTYDIASPDPCARRNLLRRELSAPLGSVVPSRVIFAAQYDAAFQLPKHVKLETGAETRFVYDFDILPLGASGRLLRTDLSEVVTADSTTQYSSVLSEQNARGQLTAVVSPEGARTEYTYASGGLQDGFLVRQTADVGGSELVTEYEYDARGFRARVTTGGRPMTFTRNALGQAETIQPPDIGGEPAEPVRQWFGDHGGVVRRERPRGTYADPILADAFFTDFFDYDLLGRPSGVRLAANTAAPRTLRLCLDHYGSPAATVDPLGGRTERVFDERGALLRETRAVGTPDQEITRYFYDVAARLRFIEEPNGARTEVLSRDPWGRLLRGRLASGAEFTYAWEAGDLLVEAGVEGSPGPGLLPCLLSRLRYDYDQRGRLRAESRLSFVDNPALGVPLTTRYQYDRSDRLVEIQRPAGDRLRFQHDGLDRLTRTSDDFGNVREAAFDVGGDLHVLTAAELGSGINVSCRFSYDARGRLVVFDGPQGRTEIDYDERNEPITQRLSDGISIASAIDAFGQTTEQVVDPGDLHLRSQWVHDAVGRLVRYIDPTGATTKWTYDPLGRIRKLTLPDGATELRTFENAGHQVSRIAASGTRVTFDFVATVDMPVRMSCAPGLGLGPVPPHDFDYDALGRLVRATAAGEAVECQYDSLGRLVGETSRGKSVSLAYDDTAMTTDLIYPDGRRERTQFDARGRPTGITLVNAGDLGGTLGESLAQIDYSPAGRPLTIRHANGVSAALAYDNAGRMVRMEYTRGGTMLDSYRVNYDGRGRRTVVQILGQPPVNTVHSFDAKSRLREVRTGFPLPPMSDAGSAADHALAISAARTAAATSSTVETYKLNAADSRIERVRLTGGATTTDTYVYGTDHKLLSVAGQPVTHDPDGNRATDPEHRYEMDALGRVARVLDSTGATVHAEFSYDALSRVVGGVEDGVACIRWFHGQRWVHEQRGSAGTTSQATPHPLFPQPLCVRDDSDVRYPHPDGGLTTLCVTDETGAVRERHRYGPFGEPSLFAADGVTPLPDASSRSELIWRGMPFVAAIGLYATPERLYDQRTGLFIRRDPLLYADSPSPYAFAGHNPADFADFTGFEKAPLGAPRSDAAVKPAEVRTGLDKWFNDDSRGLFWYTPRSGDLIKESGPVDTGSTLKNYALNGWISVSNLVAAIINTPFEIMEEADDSMRHSRFGMEWQAFMVMGPMMKTMGLAAELPGGVRYLAYSIPRSRTLSNLAMRGVFMSGAVAVGGGAAVSRSGSLRRIFMDRSLQTILANPNHPLSFLVNRQSGSWIARSHLSEEPTAQAGHLLTRWMADLLGDVERFGVEDALLNQLTNWLGETGSRAWFAKEAVEVEGVVVELETLKRWANEVEELIPYIDRARSPGWSISDP